MLDTMYVGTPVDAHRCRLLDGLEQSLILCVWAELDSADLG